MDAKGIPTDSKEFDSECGVGEKQIWPPRQISHGIFHTA